MDTDPRYGVINSSALDRARILPHLIEHRAAVSADRTFITTVDGPVVTYGEAHEVGLKWAAALQSIGLEPGQRIISMLPVSSDAVMAWLGIGWARGWEVPVNTD